MSLHPADTAELAELLQFPADWLAARHKRPDPSLRTFTGNDAYGVRQLRADLERFSFLPSGNDGEQLPGPLRH